MTPDATPVQQPVWFKSSYSGANETECVEAAFVDRGTSIRDSKRPHEAQLTFSGATWEVFVDALRESSPMQTRHAGER